MELWNKNDISMPPNNSVIMKKRDIDITHLKSILNGALKAMEDEHLLHKEAAVLSRLIFKLQRPLRGQKGLMCIYKVNRGLKRYLSLDLQYVYNNFSKILSCVEDINDCVYVPTKQMLQYLLVRTQGFCKIMKYVSEACEDAAQYFKGIIRLGHILNISLLSLSLVSRIWFCARYLMICACQCYNQLLPYLEKLKIKGPCWLPTEYTFPENLGSWLGSNLITGDLKCDVDIQKISEDLSLIKKFKDLGTLVNREDFIARKKEKVGILGKSVKMDFLNKKGKLSTDLTAELMMNSINPSETGNKPGENRVDNLNDLVAQDVENKSVHSIINVSNSMPLKNDLGEQISRDQFLALKTKKKSFSSTANEEPNGNSEKLCRDNQKLSLGTIRNDTGETCTFINGEISERKSKTQLRKGLQSPLKLKSSMSITKSGVNIANEGRQTSVANKDLSPKTLPDASCLSGASQDAEKKLVSNDISDFKVLNVDKKKISMDRSFKCMQMENEFIHSIESSITLNDNKDIGYKFEIKSNAEHISDISEVQQESASAFKKKKKSSLGNWEIIHGIRTLKDVKAFLISEKKARKKGKSCVTSQLNNSEWVVLFESINKHFKKKDVSKLKGNRLKPVIEEIRNTLIAFVI